MSIRNLENCPQCNLDLNKSIEAMGGSALRFCPGCNFPILLVAGKYQLEKIIGKGGFGTVYLAKHVRLFQDAERVIKILSPEVFSIPGMEERFFREVQLTSVLSQKYEHIVRVYDDFGELPGNMGHFYIMEYLQGTPLNEIIEDKKNLPALDLCFHVFQQLCDTMNYAHNSGVVHRDLKPENIFLIERGGDPHFLKILDFGIARPMNQSDLKKTGLTQGALGTPFYMSPEQCTNQNVDHRSDIYAMGIILYELMVGHTPFDTASRGGERSSILEIMMAIMNQTPPSPLKQRPDRVTPELERVIGKALNKDPNYRWQTTEEFKEAVYKVFENYPLGNIGDNTSSIPVRLHSSGGSFTTNPFRTPLPSTSAQTDISSESTAMLDEEQVSKEFENHGLDVKGSLHRDFQKNLEEDNEVAPSQKGKWMGAVLVLLLLLGAGGAYLSGWFVPGKSKTIAKKKIVPRKVEEEKVDLNVFSYQLSIRGKCEKEDLSASGAVVFDLDLKGKKFHRIQLKENKGFDTQHAILNCIQTELKKLRFPDFPDNAVWTGSMSFLFQGTAPKKIKKKTRPLLARKKSKKQIIAQIENEFEEKTDELKQAIRREYPNASGKVWIFVSLSSRSSGFSRIKVKKTTHIFPVDLLSIVSKKAHSWRFTPYPSRKKAKPLSKILDFGAAKKKETQEKQKIFSECPGVEKGNKLALLSLASGSLLKAFKVPKNSRVLLKTSKLICLELQRKTKVKFSLKNYFDCTVSLRFQNEKWMIQTLKKSQINDEEIEDYCLKVNN